MRPPIRRFAIMMAVVLSAIATTRCTDSSGTEPNSLQFAPAQKVSPAGVTVSATNPSYGHQGQIGESVVITGSGFAAGATVTWNLNGVADAHVSVRSASLVSATEIDAVIDVASDAQLTLYDVAVTNTDRSKGIGSELFEITTATSIGSLGGTTIAVAANDLATGSRVVGTSFVGNVRHAFVWAAPSGPMLDIGPGYANAIDDAGTRIVGEAANLGSYASIWTNAGSGWTAVRLPVASTATGGTAMSIASDASGSAMVIAGSQLVTSWKSTVEQPVLWRAAGAGWSETLLNLPAAYVGVSTKAYAVNARGQAVGVISASRGIQAVFWDSLGNPTALPGSSIAARAIDATGTIAAGSHNGVAAYWTAVVDAATGQRSWSGPFDLPLGCDKVMGIDLAQRLISRNCTSTTNGRSAGVVFMPPAYTTYTQLGGLGNSATAGEADGISPNGFLVGSAPTGPNGTSVGAVWRFLSP